MASHLPATATFASGTGTELTTASLYLVEYERGDRVGQLLAYLSLLPMHIVFAMACFVVIRRELHTMTFFSGLLGNEAFNYVLKQIIKEPRPLRAGQHVLVKYGMPSSHSQFMGFFASYALCYLFLVARPERREDCIMRLIYAVIVVVAAVFVCYSRIYLFYHTIQQVCVGVSLGTVVGLAWHVVTERALRPLLFAALERHPLAEMFMVRDSDPIGIPMRIEYEAVMRIKSKQRQNSGGNDGKRK